MAHRSSVMSSCTTRLQRAIIALVLILVAFYAPVSARKLQCDKAAISRICSDKGVGMWCHPCDEGSYVVCEPGYLPRANKCAEGLSWDPVKWQCMPSSSTRGACAPYNNNKPSNTAVEPGLEDLANLLGTLTTSVAGFINNLTTRLSEAVAGTQQQVKEVLSYGPSWSPADPLPLMASLNPVLPRGPPASFMPKPAAPLRSTMLLGHLNEQPPVEPPMQDPLLLDSTEADYLGDVPISKDVSVELLQEEALDLMQSAQEAALVADVQRAAADRIEAALAGTDAKSASVDAVLQTAAGLRKEAAELDAQAETMQEAADGLLSVAAVEAQAGATIPITPLLPTGRPPADYPDVHTRVQHTDDEDYYYDAIEDWNAAVNGHPSLPTSAAGSLTARVANLADLVHDRLADLAHQVAAKKLSKDPDAVGDSQWVTLLMQKPVSMAAAKQHEKQRAALVRELELVLQAGQSDPTSPGLNAQAWTSSLSVAAVDLARPELVMAPALEDFLHGAFGGPLTTLMQQQLTQLYQEALLEAEQAMQEQSVADLQRLEATGRDAKLTTKEWQQQQEQQQQELKAPSSALKLRGAEAVAWRSESSLEGVHFIDADLTAMSKK